MAATQVHLIDPAAGGMILVLCEDGSRVLFGTSVVGLTPSEVAQRVFEVLEDGHIDYFIHAGIEPDGKVDLAGLSEFFPIKTCAELTGPATRHPAAYAAFRNHCEIEELEPDDVLEFGRTSIRILGAPVCRMVGGVECRPLALHVAHESEEGTTALLALGATGASDWLAITESLEQPLVADCLVVDGRRPLEIVISAGPKNEVSIDLLRRIAPSSVVVGADGGAPPQLRQAALSLFECFTRDNPGGAGVIDMRTDAWLSLTLDGKWARVAHEPRALGQAA